MVTAFMLLCWVSTSVRLTQRSSRTTGSGSALDAEAGLACKSAAGALGGAAEPDGLTGALAALGAGVLLGFAASPAACLHRSDSESLCSLRHATILPPPGCTVAQNFCASSAQATRMDASGSLDCADCASANAT